MAQQAFSYERVKARRNKLFSRALRPYIDASVTGSVIYDICNDILAELPNTVSQTALFDSIRALAGTQLTSSVAGTLAWRLAGNLDRLIDGLPVLPWTQQVGDEKVPVVVESVRPVFRKPNQPDYLVSCRAVAGTPCPMTFTRLFSKSSCRAISRSLGFSAPWGSYPYSTPLHFVNLMFFAHVEAAKSRDVPYFLRVSASGSMIKANRRLLEVRCRAKPCPQGYEHSCANCWVGHDACESAVHARTYEPRHCNACNTNSFFDPDEPGIMCVRCRFPSWQWELV